MFFIRTENPVGARSAQNRLSDATEFRTPYIVPAELAITAAMAAFVGPLTAGPNEVDEDLPYMLG